MLKIGIIGVGHLGKIHLKCLQQLHDFYEIKGFYDVSEEEAKKVATQFNIPSFSSPEALIEQCDVIDVVTPTIYHYEYAEKVLKASKHLFIEKPVCHTIEEANALLKLAEESGSKVQVGHVERFNPAYLSSAQYIENPMFIEGHRLAEFNPRGTDVSVVLDLMIHDLDIVLKTVNSEIKKISASGVAVVSDTPDIANARIEFHNGCVANLTASRISLKNMRKIRMFQRDAYISMDFLEKSSQIVKLKELEGKPGDFDIVLDLGEGKPKKQIFFQSPECKPNNAIAEELKSFFYSITENKEPAVSLFDGVSALKAAHMILEKINESLQILE
ncbi:MAG: gfo/Idh/MocA family oxidoreductase [Bacteroidetes bacterium]|nr:MAG: gfo/Idh/MocA family oxidoreductase [Bacteroidota bacterium]